MKKNIGFIISLAAGLCFVGCTDGFEENNQNPYAISRMEPGYLFTGAERAMNAGNWDGEQTIVQQYVNAYNAGATAGFQFNEDVDGYNTPRWGIYTTVIRPLVQIINTIKDDPAYQNQYHMARIWKAYAFMTLVDTYGDVPYFNAGLGFLEGIKDPSYNFPTYDKAADIYEDLYNELKTATEALSASNEYVKNDLFFGASTSTAAAQVVQWKKVGYSLLLRLGMRYSKVDPAKAAKIAQEAFAGGVMQSNADNVFTNLYTTSVPNNFSNLQRTVSPYFYYLTEPFVNQLKNTFDPRLKYIGASYAKPESFTSARDTTRANQYGFPIGYDQVSVKKFPGYRGEKPGGQNYTQLNYQVIASNLAPAFFITNSQTQLLLAEAKFRGWITGGLTPKEYYEAGVKSAMDEWSLFPGVLSPAITTSQKNTYLARPGVAYNSANALELINTQYWICSVTNGAEAFANWRRSGYPVLKPNLYNNNLNGGFVRRMAYPNSEAAQNPDSYNAAVASMGGDGLTQRVFWDVP